MSYYAVEKGHDVVGRWQEIDAETLAAAKRQATSQFGGSYCFREIHLVEISKKDFQAGLVDINSIPSWTKSMSVGAKWERPR